MGNKDEVVQPRHKLAPAPGVLKAQADLHTPAAAAPPARARAPRPNREKEDEDNGDEEDGDEEEGGEEDDEEDEEDDDPDADEDEAEAEEDDVGIYDAKCIHAQRGKGKSLCYHVEWEECPDMKDWTWEPPAHMEGTEALEAWEEGGKAAWEAAKKKKSRK